MIDSLSNEGINVPYYVFDPSNNQTDCVGQAANPSLGGHSIDNFNLRTLNMATLFASRIDTTCFTSISEVDDYKKIKLFPQPSSGIFTILTIENPDRFKITSVTGVEFSFTSEKLSENKFEIHLTTAASGIYYLTVFSKSKTYWSKIVID